jgi:Terpene cyclase DEP1
MKPKNVYLVLCVLGTAIPYYQFLRWLGENGPNASLFFQQMFADRINTFFALDVLISAIVLLRFIAVEGSRLHIPRRWPASLSVILVGVSLGLPLFLYLRERHLETNPL